MRVRLYYPEPFHIQPLDRQILEQTVMRVKTLIWIIVNIHLFPFLLQFLRINYYFIGHMNKICQKSNDFGKRISMKHQKEKAKAVKKKKISMQFSKELQAKFD